MIAPTRSPIPFDRKIMMEVAARQRAIDKGHKFYYVPFQCDKGHYSRRSVEDCSCEKCWQPEERAQRLEAARLRRDEMKVAVQQRQRAWKLKRIEAKARREAIEAARRERMGWK